MKALRYILLLPFSLLYGFTVFLRNSCYNLGLFKTHRFKQKIISLGNLSTGGTGKTPHTEYLIQLLSEKHITATLSRGYKRKSSGFLLANEQSSALDIGDEPLQFKKKFKNITVAVDEKRVHGVEELLKINPDLELILLDDGYQHRSIERGLNILITDYNHLYCHDHLLPGGNLREWQSGSKRADLIIVSKSPGHLPAETKQRIINELKPLDRQKVFFTSIKYGNPTPYHGLEFSLPQKETAILALCGIGNPTPFLEYLENNYSLKEKLIFSDHHAYSIKDIQTIKSQLDKISAENKAIITTEKDIMRLYLPELKNAFANIPIFYLPIEVSFPNQGKVEFDNEILNYVRSN